MNCVNIRMHGKTIEILDRFLKNTHVSNLMKTRPLGAEFSMLTDRRIHVAVRNVAHAPKNQKIYRTGIKEGIKKII